MSSSLLPTHGEGVVDGDADGGGGGLPGGVGGPRRSTPRDDANSPRPPPSASSSGTAASSRPRPRSPRNNGGHAPTTEGGAGAGGDAGAGAGADGGGGALLPHRSRDLLPHDDPAAQEAANLSAAAVARRMGLLVTTTTADPPSGVGRRLLTKRHHGNGESMLLASTSNGAANPGGGTASSSSAMGGGGYGRRSSTGGDHNDDSANNPFLSGSDPGGTSSYVPPTTTTTTTTTTSPVTPTSSPYHDGNRYIKSVSSTLSETDSMVSGVIMHAYDREGQPAPYYEGPYLVTSNPDGTRRKRRWYGRMEDGYIAWMSIHLFEKFGITVYQPLNPIEMRQGKVPTWMYEFFSLPNIAIPLSYFCIGVALQLLRTPLIVYFIEDKGATAAEVNVLFTVMAVPWCFKVLYGFLSDCVPISGLRRRPYFMVGWVVYVASNLILAMTPAPSIGMCIFFVFVQTAGYMLADVMTDALIVERSRYESDEKRGTMQSQGYIIRFFGSTVGATIGAVSYNKDSWDWYLPINVVFFINAAFPMLMLIPVVPFLMEIETDCAPRNFWDQCRDLFHTVQLRSVWQPMTFVYVYNALQLTNAAWMNFLVEGLNFTAWMIGIVGIAGSLMAWFGIMAYKKFFFASNWRIVYFWCTTLASAIAIAQLILVFGLNRRVGLSDILFSVGDDVLVEFVIAVQFLPMCIMYLGLCPPGSEGTTYAMLTTWSNLAGTVAFDISTALTAVWDVSSEAIQSGDYAGVWKLSLLCGLVGPIPLVLLGLIPKNKADQKTLQEDTYRHYWGGVIFVAVMFLSLFITFAESIYEVVSESHEEMEYEEESNMYEQQRRRLARMIVGH